MNLNKTREFFYLQKNSLKARLIVSALLLIIVILPIIGITLNNAFEEQIRESIQNELSAYSYSILAVAEVENNQLIMPEQLLDNQLNVSQTGLYALLVNTKNEEILWRSKSLLGLADPINLPSPKLGDSAFNEISLDSKAHLIYSFSVSFGEDENALLMTLHILKDQTSFQLAISDFRQQLWTWLAVLMLLLVIVQMFWLYWTLKPLRTLKQELAIVEQGKSAQLTQNYPQELSAVTKQVNVLLTTEQNQRQRYRNALSDLAHSLKTPLAVMQSQLDLSDSSQEQLNLINQTIEHQLKRAQSAGKSAWHLGINIKPIAKKLIKTLNKIHQQKQLTIKYQIDEKSIFKGDEADLMEILGNLLDNACKAAQAQINLTILNINKTIEIRVEDDGKGVEETQRNIILQRGIRSDTYQKGHGIGLAIVRDLVDTYQGQLTISKSPELGGALFAIKFSL